MALPVFGGSDPGPIDPDEVQERLRPSVIGLFTDAVVGVVFLVIAWTLIGSIGAVSIASWTTGGGLYLLAGLMAALAGLRWLGRAVGSRPRIEWTEDHLIDRTGLLGGELRIPWSDIREIHTERVSAVVRVELEEDAGILRDLGIFQRLRFALLRLRGIDGLQINPSFLRVDWRELGGALEEVLLQTEFEDERGRLTPSPAPPVDESIPPETS